MQKERRNNRTDNDGANRGELTAAQRGTLADLEAFGWKLRFIRHPLFQEAVAVVVDAAGGKHAVLQKDGSLNERPGFDIRS